MLGTLKKETHGSWIEVYLKTKSSQITDMFTGIVGHLAASTATSLTSLSTNSLFYRLLKFALDAAGVQYSIAANGYICLGALFGGLILQWGIENTIPSDRSIYFPITFPQNVFVAHLQHIDGSGQSNFHDSVYQVLVNKTIVISPSSSNDTQMFLAIGI